MQLSDQKIKILHEYFRNKPVLKAYLFGSQARNEASINSDIDILLELDYSQKIGLLFVQMKIDLENLLNNKVDLLTEKGISKYIKPTVDGEKKLIYVR